MEHFSAAPISTRAGARVAAGALERVQVTRDLQRQVHESRNLLSLAQLLEGNDAIVPAWQPVLAPLLAPGCAPGCAAATIPSRSG